MKLLALLAAIAVAGACAAREQHERSPAGGPQIINHFQVDSASSDFLAEYRELLQKERVLCLYGFVSGDTAWLNFIKPAKMRERTQHLAAFEACPIPKKPAPFARYLGTWHNHTVTGWDGCAFSVIDEDTFKRDKMAIVDVVSCSGKLLARSKFK